MTRRLLAINPVDHPGGAETTLLRLLCALSDRGWTVTATTPGTGPLADMLAEAGHRLERLALGGLGAGQGARALAAFPRVRALAAGHDVVYLNGAVCGRLLPALIPLGGLRRVACHVVLHVHDIVARTPRFWRLADRILADSAATARAIHGIRSEAVGCPVDADPPDVPPPWPSVTGGGAVVGFVGRLEPRKGPLDLVRAAPAIRARHPRARVVLVGDDRYGADPGYAEELLASPEVEHVPWVEGAAGLMRHLDVLVLPSYREPFGAVLAEAMAVGTPVVATAVDGLPEVVRDGVTGRLVAPGEPEALAAAVAEVLDRREEFGAAGRAWASRFHTERYVERVEPLLSAA